MSSTRRRRIKRARQSARKWGKLVCFGGKWARYLFVRDAQCWNGGHYEIYNVGTEGQSIVSKIKREYELKGWNKVSMLGTDLPSDYEACGVCGWDHSYDYEKAIKVDHHYEEGDETRMIHTQEIKA